MCWSHRCVCQREYFTLLQGERHWATAERLCRSGGKFHWVAEETVRRCHEVKRKDARAIGRKWCLPHTLHAHFTLLHLSATVFPCTSSCSCHFYLLACFTYVCGNPSMTGNTKHLLHRPHRRRRRRRFRRCCCCISFYHQLLSTCFVFQFENLQLQYEARSTTKRQKAFNSFIRQLETSSPSAFLLLLFLSLPFCAPTRCIDATFELNSGSSSIRANNKTCSLWLFFSNPYTDTHTHRQSLKCASEHLSEMLGNTKSRLPDMSN